MIHITQLFDSSASSIRSNGETSAVLREFASGIDLLEKTLKIETDQKKRFLCESNIEAFRKRIDSIYLSQGDNALRAAILLDESRDKKASVNNMEIQACKDAYLGAVESYMKVHQRDSSLKKRISNLLDRIQALKDMMDRSFTSAEDLDDLLPVAPVVLHATGKSSSLSSTSKGAIMPSDELVSAAAESGEKWIGAAKKSNPEALLSTATLKSGGLGLSEVEIAVLRASSVVNGKIFMPWLPGQS